MNSTHFVKESLQVLSDLSFRRISKDIVVSKTPLNWSQEWDIRWIFKSVTEYLKTQKTTKTHEIVITRRRGQAVLRMNNGGEADFSKGEVLVRVRRLEGYWIFDLVSS